MTEPAFRKPVRTYLSRPFARQVCTDQSVGTFHALLGGVVIPAGRVAFEVTIGNPDPERSGRPGSVWLERFDHGSCGRVTVPGSEMRASGRLTLDLNDGEYHLAARNVDGMSARLTSI